MARSGFRWAGSTASPRRRTRSIWPSAGAAVVRSYCASEADARGDGPSGRNGAVPPGEQSAALDESRARSHIDSRYRNARNPSVTRRARFTAARRPASFHAPVLEKGDTGRLDGPDLLDLHHRVPEVVE